MRDRWVGLPILYLLLLVELAMTTKAFLLHHRAPTNRAVVGRVPTARRVVMMSSYDDDDIRLSMSQTHMETGFLKRPKAQPLYENPELLNAEVLNDIYGPEERDNMFVLRSMWTASCIFRLDGILLDSADLQMRAWERVADSAADGGKRLPTMNQVFAAMHVSPEEAIRTVFAWTDEEVEARELSETFDKVILEELKRQDLYPIQGAVELIEDMIGNEVPCAVISNLPLEAIEYVLEELDILPMIEVVEGFDGRLKTEAQLLLMACLEMERPPKHAVLFDFSAEAVDLAHDHDMKAVVLDGLYYQEMEVTQCDAKLTKLTDWTMPRFRQLLEEYPFDEDELTRTAMATARVPTKRKISVATYDMYKYEKGSDGKVVPTQDYLDNQKKRQEWRDRLRSSRKAPPEGSRFLSPGGGRSGDAGDDVPELPDL